MSNQRRTMPVCFTTDQVKMLEKYVKENGMINFSQAVEQIIINKIKE